MELSRFAPAYGAYETLNMNGLNHKLKVAMLVRTYSSYQEMYDTVINEERAHNKRQAFFNKKTKRKGRPQDHKI